MLVKIKDLKQCSKEVLEAVGVPINDAEIIVNSIIYAHTRGKHTHGIGRMPIYIRKIKEKQIDATFSYLTRLNVRLKFFNDIFITYGEEIMDCFIPENYRREIVPDRISLVSERIKDLAENAKETLKFIRDENNQMPAQKGWVDKFNTFVEFLIDCEQLDQSIYYKWSIMDEYEEKKSQYYEENSKNIQELLRMVHERQIKLEEEMFKKN